MDKINQLEKEIEQLVIDIGIAGQEAKKNSKMLSKFNHLVDELLNKKFELKLMKEREKQ